MDEFSRVNCTPSSLTFRDLPRATGFRLSAQPESDIYAAPGPPEIFQYSAPIIQKRLSRSSFERVKVTVSATWEFQFDQGGILVVAPTLDNPNPDGSNAINSSTHPAWVKVGIEVNDGAPHISIVGRAMNGWCDWSLVYLNDCGLGHETPATLELTRFKNALMIKTIMEDGQKILIRKVPWVFLDQPGMSSDLLVGLYAARPDPNREARGQDLSVEFRDFEFKYIPHDI